MNEMILPGAIANACFEFAGWMFYNSPGNLLNLDGSVAAAFVRNNDFLLGKL